MSLAGQPGKVAAFFDIDHTVLEINSGTKWTQHQWRSGGLSAWQLAQAMGWLFKYRFGLLDYDAMAQKVLRSYAGKAVQPIYEEVATFFEVHVRPTICGEARERIEEHRRQGHVVALLTSATHFLSLQVGRALEVEHILCTEVEVDEAGILTGRHITPACYGTGKVVKAEHFAQAHGIDLGRSFFYSDSCSDLPMLERVGEPRVVNPDPRLRRTAAARGWTFEVWRAPRAVAVDPLPNLDKPLSR